MIHIHKSLTLDLNEIATVWRARVEVYNPDADEEYIELWECPFNIAQEAAAQEWIDERAAAALARYADGPDGGARIVP